MRERRLRPLENHSALFVDKQTHAVLRETMSPDLYATMFLHAGKPLIPHGTHLLGGAMAGLQVTLQGPDARATRWLHDQLMALSPVLMALTASSPVRRGFLSDTDCRWEVMERTLDDRTAAEERDNIARSRCTSYPLYVAEGENTALLNDVPVILDDLLAARLEGGGMDRPLARFYAHLFSRDPLVANDAVLQEAEDAASDGHLCFEVGSHLVLPFFGLSAHRSSDRPSQVLTGPLSSCVHPRPTLRLVGAPSCAPWNHSRPTLRTAHFACLSHSLLLPSSQKPPRRTGSISECPSRRCVRTMWLSHELKLTVEGMAARRQLSHSSEARLYPRRPLSRSRHLCAAVHRRDHQQRRGE